MSLIYREHNTVHIRQLLSIDDTALIFLYCINQHKWNSYLVQHCIAQHVL